MYPKNSASPVRIAIGPVVQISDGAVQTSGVSVKVLPQGGAAGAGGGTTAYEEGVVHYIPTQAETNYTGFILIAYKTGCIPCSVTIVTSASGVAGYAGLDWATINAPTTAQNLSGTNIDVDQVVASVSGTVATVTNLTNLPAITANWLTAAGTAADFTTEIQAGLATAAALTTVAGYIDTEIGDIQARLPAALVGGRMDSNVSAIGNDTTALTAFKRAVLSNVIGTVGAASTTTSIVTSSLLPAAAVIDQFKGRIVIFDKDTATANLRGQGTDITGNTALGVLTVTALTTAPASGDTFTIT